MAGAILFAFAAGALSVLSPCVLPILPIVFGAAASRHRWGFAAAALGAAAAFTAVGLFIATVGFSIGLDGEVFRGIAALVLVGFGLVLLVPALQDRFASAAGRLGSWTGPLLERVSVAGLRGQFVLGLVLGLAWIPCVGPTLGAASVLASQGRDLGQVAFTMLAFGLGASLPLAGLGALAGRLSSRRRGALVRAGTRARAGLGAMAGAIGVLILSGLDRSLETLLVEASPAWLTRLTTQF